MESTQLTLHFFWFKPVSVVKINSTSCNGEEGGGGGGDGFIKDLRCVWLCLSNIGTSYPKGERVGGFVPSPWFIQVRTNYPKGEGVGGFVPSSWFIQIRTNYPKGEGVGGFVPSPWFIQIRTNYPKGEGVGGFFPSPWFIQVRTNYPKGEGIRWFHSKLTMCTVVQDSTKPFKVGGEVITKPTYIASTVVQVTFYGKTDYSSKRISDFL